MDEEISIIDSKTRNEKIKHFFIENKKKLISITIILIVSVLSFYSFQIYKDKQIERISDNFNSAVIEFKNGDKSKSTSSMKEVVKDKDSTYSPLALYFLIDNNLLEKQKEIRHLIIYKKALYNADFVDEIQILEMLKPVLNSESVWKSHALYLIAEFFYSKKEMQKSKEFFEKIISTENANQDIFIEAQKRLNRDLGE